MAMRSLFLLLVALLAAHGLDDDSPLSCSLDEKEQERDPALKEMKFDVGDGPETFVAYVQPHVTTFYHDINPPASTAVKPKYTGLAGMFINMSDEPVRLYWYVNVPHLRVLVLLNLNDSRSLTTFFLLSTPGKPLSGVLDRS